MNRATPFACNMGALSSHERSVHSELEQRLRSALVGVQEVANGFEFEFPLNSTTYDAIARITPLEHACCPFFAISIRVERDKLFWSLTGNDGVKQFIRMEFTSWFE